MNQQEKIIRETMEELANDLVNLNNNRTQWSTMRAKDVELDLAELIRKIRDGKLE